MHPGLELRRVGSGQRFTFADAETRLTEWMAENARVCWTVCGAPWTVEEKAIAKLCLRLNLDQNDRHPFHPVLTSLRAAARQRARELPIWTAHPSRWVFRRSDKPGLDTLAALAAGLIVDLGARVPYGRTPSRNQYTATARAVAALRRRGLVETETVGTRKGRMEWLRGAHGKVTPRWRTTNPSKYVLVRVRVDSSKAVRYRFRSGVTRE